MIESRHDAACINRQHARRNRIHHRFHVRSTSICFDVRAHEGVLAARQIRGHVVERVNQRPDFVGRVDGNSHVQLSSGHGFRPSASF